VPIRSAGECAGLFASGSQQAGAAVAHAELELEAEEEVEADLELMSRFFHRMSAQPPYESKFPALEAPNVVPKAFKGTWEGRVGEWGLLLRQA
jgi:hypothetical protein